jgi:hypothetical protein
LIGSADYIPKLSFWWKIGIYVLIGVGLFFLLLIKGIWCGFMIRRSQKKIHDDLLNHVIHAPISFYSSIVFLFLF